MEQQVNNPFHGITLEILLTRLVKHYGWEKLATHFYMNCFQNEPSIKSCLKFLRKNPWARKKVEGFYMNYGNPPWRKE
jgi:uncharacterized protein (DUF2132 family)